MKRVAPSRLRHIVRAPVEIDAPTRARMLELMRLAFDNITDERFTRDLENKQHVICLLDDDGVLQGFSTVRIAEETLEGKRVDIMFSGDTVLHPDWWGTKIMQGAFLAFTVRQKLKHPRRPLYWLMLALSYKSYLALTNNFPTAFPRRDATPPPSLLALRDRVARAWWGAEYNDRTEILHYAVARERVKPFVMPRDPATLAQPDIAYFIDRNPGWAEGDALVCFAELDFALGVRWFSKQTCRFFGLGSREAGTGTPVRPARATQDLDKPSL